jgi:hypothetical protein
MKFRVFYAPQVFRTWEKIYVLTSDDRLYCEFLMRFSRQTIERNGMTYENFAPKNFSWGTGVEGNKGVAFTNYQECEKELTWNEYKNLSPSSLLSGYSSSISSQIRWVESYLRAKGLTEKDWDEEIYNKFNLK